MIRCQPHNPKVQGKVQSHQVSRHKICYDIIHQKKPVVNWLIDLLEYMKKYCEIEPVGTCYAGLLAHHASDPRKDFQRTK